MSFLLTSSEVHFFFSFLLFHYYKCTDPGEQLLSVPMEAAVFLHNYFSLKQPSQSSLRKRTSCAQPWRPCWGKTGSSMASFPQDAPAEISTYANNSEMLLLHSTLLDSRSQSPVQWQHHYLLFTGRNDQFPGHLRGHHTTENGRKGTCVPQSWFQPLGCTSSSPQQELEKVVKLLLYCLLMESQAVS